MTPKNPTEKPAHLNIREIPRETLFRLKMAAAAEQKTVKDLVMELIEKKLQELEKKGVLPKNK
jgi:predicted DNA-binding protein